MKVSHLFNKWKKKKILIVEDDPDIAAGLAARLALEKYEIICASDGEEGVEKARLELPDLIILDIMVPKIDGYEVCKIVKEEECIKHIPVLVLTALPFMGDAEKAFGAGANDFFHKPYSNKQLLRKVRKLIP